MKVEPHVDREALVQKLAALYGISVSALAFVPEGETSVAYAVSTGEGRRFLVKLWPSSRQGLAMRARLGVTLPLTRELYERGLVPNLPCPVTSAAGELLHPFGEYALCLFPFLQGRPLPEDRAGWPPGMLEALAKTYANLHRAAPLLKSPLPDRPAFDMSFAGDFTRGLARLEDGALKERPGLVGLRDLLLPRRAQLLGWLEETFDLCAEAQRSAGPLVLCHTDMGGNNLLVDGAGRLSIIDWDDLILAPAEHDVHEYRGEDFGRFIELYYSAGGVRPLQTLQFAFYLKRRYLSDLTDWMARIQEESGSAEQDGFDLAGIEQYSLAYLDRFPREMEEIDAALGN